MALANQGVKLKALERWREEMPTEQEMLPRDKYTMFDRKEKRYRKGIHSTFHSTLSQEEMGNHADRHARATEVDESITKSQPPRLLDDRIATNYHHCTLSGVLFGLGAISRFP